MDFIEFGFRSNTVTAVRLKEDKGLEFRGARPQRIERRSDVAALRMRVVRSLRVVKLHPSVLWEWYEISLDSTLCASAEGSYNLVCM